MPSSSHSIAHQKGIAAPFPFQSKTNEELIEFINSCNLHDKRVLIELLSRDMTVYLNASCTFHGSDEIMEVCINGSTIQICIDEQMNDLDVHMDHLADRATSRAMPDDGSI